MTRARILILDDERSGVQHLFDALNEYHNVHYARSIHDAKGELEHKHYDLIVCGVHLLHESMFEFLHDMRKTAQGRGIPFVCFRAVQSKFGQALDAPVEAAARMLGADDYVIVETDNADATSLRERIETHLRKR